MADFKTIHTAFGLEAMTQAESTGIPINLTEMAVGDTCTVYMPGDEAALAEFRASLTPAVQEGDG